MDKIRDCHYCNYAMCNDSTGWCACYCDDNCYFDHTVEDSKEAETCDMFEYCDVFPKN